MSLFVIFITQTTTQQKGIKMKIKTYLSLLLITLTPTFSATADSSSSTFSPSEESSWESFKNNDSEIDVKFGGWSNHSSDKPGYMEVPLNENHRGFGLEYYKSLSDSNKHWVGLGGWYMKDSFDSDSFQLSVAYKYRLYVDFLIHSIDFNINVGAVNRTYVDREFLVDRVNNTETFIGYHFERDTRFTSAPMITVNFTENMHADFTYLPEFIADANDEYELFFFRLGYKFK